jgi:hypothetical protein
MYVARDNHRHQWLAYYSRRISMTTMGALASFTRKTHNHVSPQDEDGRGLATPVVVVSANTVSKLVTVLGAYSSVVSSQSAVSNQQLLLYCCRNAMHAIYIYYVVHAVNYCKMRDCRACSPNRTICMIMSSAVLTLSSLSVRDRIQLG